MGVVAIIMLTAFFWIPFGAFLWAKWPFPTHVKVRGREWRIITKCSHCHKPDVVELDSGVNWKSRANLRNVK